MSIRLPRITIKTVPITCRLDADLHADLEAYAAMFEAERGKPIPLPTLITTIVQDYLQHDPDFVRERRQTTTPRARPKSTGPDRHHSVPHLAVPHTREDDGAP